MTSDRHDPDATPDAPDEFWGERTEWTPRPQPTSERPGLGATLSRWWNGLAGGTDHAQRTHGDARPGTARFADDAADHGVTDDSYVDDSDVAGGYVDGSYADERFVHERVDDDTVVDDAWELEPEPQPSRAPGVDPLIARLGGLAVVITLAAPLVLGITASGSGSDGGPVAGDERSAPAATLADGSVGTESTPAQDAPVAAVTEPAATSATEPAASSTTGDTTEVVDRAPESTADTPEAATLETAEAPDGTTAGATEPATIAPACGNDYDTAAGDYWIRIADAAGVSLADLLAVNDASVDTVLVPGRSICLPVGALTPSPPTTVATPAPSPRPPADTPSRPATPSAPVTTAAPAPTTTSPPRPPAVGESEAAAIIRDVWPDELEERALEIAWRESNHRSNVNNYCCYGLFQIYYSVHRSWLASLGIDSAGDLYDPQLNALAAYTLYQRAGGWGPWGG